MVMREREESQTQTQTNDFGLGSARAVDEHMSDFSLPAQTGGVTSRRE